MMQYPLQQSRFQLIALRGQQIENTGENPQK